MGGGVLVDDVVITRAASVVDAQASVRLVHEPMPWVSRGGLKLAHALDAFDVPVRDRVAADVGASTGGFTDVLLDAGARKVYAIDVGYGQLAWKLRGDERVVVMERTNIRNVQQLPEPMQLCVIDVSFISLQLVLPVVHGLLVSGSDVIALIKPQFEAGRDRVPKGVVRDPAVWRDVLITTLHAALGNWHIRGLDRSPITGPAGNVEFLVHLRKSSDNPQIDADTMVDRVLQALSS